MRTAAVSGMGGCALEHLLHLPVRAANEVRERDEVPGLGEAELVTELGEDRNRLLRDRDQLVVLASRVRAQSGAFEEHPRLEAAIPGLVRLVERLRQGGVPPVTSPDARRATPTS